MATWQVTSRTMLRTMLDDIGSTKYTDDRLDQFLITAAYFLPVDINFSTDYIINVETETISPDPISQSDGPEFINFMVLRAACLTDQGSFRNAALLQGVQARCGPAVLNTSGYGQYLKDLLTNGPCKAYNELKDMYNLSYEGSRIIRAVMSPFVSNDFYPPMGSSGHGQTDTNNPVRNRGYFS